MRNGTAVRATRWSGPIRRNGANTRDLARKSGHGGGDFWTTFHFAEAIRTGKPPFLDVYRGVAMSSVGILAWKSALQDGQPFDVPDFRERDPAKALRERPLVALAEARRPGPAAGEHSGPT